MAILKSQEHNRNARIWDPDKECILFRFIDGVFETDDKYIIEFYDKHFAGKGQIKADYKVEAKEEPKTEEPDEKQLIEAEIKERFGIDVDRRLSLKKLKAKLAQLEAES